VADAESDEGLLRGNGVGDGGCGRADGNAQVRTDVHHGAGSAHKHDRSGQPTPTTPPQPTAAPTPTPPPTAIPDLLQASTFEIYAIEGASTIPGTSPSLTFGSGGSLNGSDGCNSFTGSYSIAPSSTSQGSLTPSIGAGTSLACEPEVADQAQLFYTAAGQVRAYSYLPKGLLLALLDGSEFDVMNGELK
jgi:heat shock protein HslJ